MLKIIGPVAAIVSLLLSTGVSRAANAHGHGSIGAPEVTTAGAVSISQEIRNAPPGQSEGGGKREKPLGLISPKGTSGGRPDTAIQSAVSGPAIATTNGLNIAGVGNGDYGFSPNSAPPDTNGAVGATQYVQWVNESFAVFNKATGAIAPGFPKAGNTLWAGLKDANNNPSGCAVNNDGDPVVQYDKAANRWILSQFSVTNPGTYGYLQCVAVSTTSDATGSYYQYAFPEPNFNDYPKLGVWPDGYYLTFNMFNGNTFLGGRTCALDRAKMLVGDRSAQQICFQLSTNDGGLLPSDLDGSNPPPAGAPNYVVEFGTNSLDLFKFHADFTTPANSSLSQATVIAVTPFAAACNAGGSCIPQPGTTQKLDSLADRLMYRLAYRHFTDGHEALVVDHSVTAGSSVGVRWYELRDPGGTPTVYQQGTYAPDSKYRWMGSIAMDRSGDIAMGYSESSSSLYPSIAYTGRLLGDPLGTMQAENTIVTGGGSQTGSLSRWGDYTAMTVDPVDDCTFWYTNEYLKSSGSFNWSTRIASFSFPSCVSSATPDFNVSASPTSQTVTAGNSTSYTVNVSASGGFTGNVALAASGLPAGASASFSPNPVSGGGSSTMTVTTSGSTPVGTSTLTITGTSGSTTHSTTTSLTVQGVAQPDFTLGASPSSQTVTQGQNGTYTATVTALNNFTGNVTFSTSGLPTGVTAGFSPTTVTGSGNSTLTLTVGAAVTPGSYPFTVIGTSGTLSHSASVTLVVRASTPPDFSLSASPTSVRVPRSGGSASSTITVTPSGSFNGTVNLSVTGQPNGVSARFSLSSVTGSGSSILSITSNGAPQGTYTLTVQGTSGSLTHTTPITLTITKR